MKKLNHVKNTSFWFKYGTREFDIRNVDQILNKKLSENPALSKVCAFIQSVKDFDSVIDRCDDLDAAKQKPSNHVDLWVDDGSDIPW